MSTDCFVNKTNISEWSLAPLGNRKSNDSIVNLSKCKDFGPPYQCQLRIWPPYGKLLRDRFLGEMLKFFRETPKIMLFKNFG